MSQLEQNRPQRQSSFVKNVLGWIERVGNRLPHPFFLFLILGAVVIIISGMTDGVKVLIPGTSKEVAVKNLLNADGLRYILSNLHTNFIQFPPLPTVITLMIGVGVAEESGMFRAVLRRTLAGVPKMWVTTAVIFLGICANLMSDAGIVFAGIGRNPLLGIAAGYAAVSGGFCANILITTNDVALIGITQAVLDVLPITKDYPAHLAMNWYFMIISTIFLTPIGVWITERLVAPMLGETYENNTVDIDNESKSGKESKAILAAGLSILVYIIIILLLTVPSGGLLRNPETHTILPKSPFLSGLPALLLLMFLIPGTAYGIAAGTIKSGKDVCAMMGKGIASLTGFLVVAFTAAQFIKWFGETNLATIIAVKGAEALKAAGFTDIPLTISFIIMMLLLNLFVYSSSAKWALVAPVFVPMFALLGFSPAFTQAIYRIGDSCTNIISPVFPYLPLVLGMMQRYKKDAGIGTVLSTMLPYSIGFSIMWIIIAVVWVVLDLPLGPGTAIKL